MRQDIDDMLSVLDSPNLLRIKRINIDVIETERLGQHEGRREARSLNQKRRESRDEHDASAR